MSNQYYSYSAAFVRNALARAEALNQEFSGLEDGFAKLPDPAPLREGRVTYAADTGAANAYVVALNAGITAYTEGLSLRFKAANANTGASTLNVNGIGVVAIQRLNGDPLIADDISAGQVVDVTYNGTAFRIAGGQGGETTLARAWANKTDGVVADGEFSAKEYASGGQAGTGGSAKNWAQQSGAITGASANDRSAKAWAQSDLSGATLGGSAKDWALRISGNVDGTDFSAKAYAVSEGVVAVGSAKEWAVKSSGAVAGGLFSALAYASSTGLIATGSAREWAVSEGVVADGFKGARGYAIDAGLSAVAAAASDVSAQAARNEAVAAAAVFVAGEVTYEARFQYGGFV